MTPADLAAIDAELAQWENYPSTDLLVCARRLRAEVERQHEVQRHWREVGHALHAKMEAAGWPGGGLVDGVEWLIARAMPGVGPAPWPARVATLQDLEATARRQRDEARALLRVALRSAETGIYLTDRQQARIRAALGETP